MIYDKWYIYIYIYMAPPLALHIYNEIYIQSVLWCVVHYLKLMFSSETGEPENTWQPCLTNDLAYVTSNFLRPAYQAGPR